MRFSASSSRASRGRSSNASDEIAARDASRGSGRRAFEARLRCARWIASVLPPSRNSPCATRPVRAPKAWAISLGVPLSVRLRTLTPGVSRDDDATPPDLPKLLRSHRDVARDCPRRFTHWSEVTRPAWCDVLAPGSGATDAPDLGLVRHARQVAALLLVVVDGGSPALCRGHRSLLRFMPVCEIRSFG